MAIGSAVHKGNTLYVYDEKGKQIASICMGSHGEFLGYTGTTVSIKKGRTIYVHNEKGKQISSHSC